MAQPSTNSTISMYVFLRVALIGALVIALAGAAYYVLEHWPQRGGSYPASAFEVPLNYFFLFHHWCKIGGSFKAPFIASFDQINSPIFILSFN